MIRVDVFEDALVVSGHAGAAKPGEDIVCAGVSSLLIALHDTLAHYFPRKWLVSNVLQDGYAEFAVKFDDAVVHAATIVTPLIMAERGLIRISEMHPDYVRVSRHPFKYLNAKGEIRHE